MKTLFAFAVLLMLSCASAHAARIYQLIDYPGLQNGHTLSGTITTTDDAPDDGLLNLAEILDWEWEVIDRFGVNVGQLHPTEPFSSSFTEVLGIEIDSQGIYFSHDLGRSFELKSNTNLNSRAANSLRLAWFAGNPDTPPRYAFFGIREGDILYYTWGSDIPDNPDKWRIAASVPEPTGLTLSCCVAAYAAAMLRRRKR